MMFVSGPISGEIMGAGPCWLQGGQLISQEGQPRRGSSGGLTSMKHAESGCQTTPLTQSPYPTRPSLREKEDAKILSVALNTAPDGARCVAPTPATAELDSRLHHADLHQPPRPAAVALQARDKPHRGVRRVWVVVAEKWNYYFFDFMFLQIRNDWVCSSIGSGISRCRNGTRGTGDDCVSCQFGPNVDLMARHCANLWSSPFLRLSFMIPCLIHQRLTQQPLLLTLPTRHPTCPPPSDSFPFGGG